MDYYHSIGKNIGEGWNLVILGLLKQSAVLKFKGASILDLGCAEGGYCKEALEKGAKTVIGYEQNPVMIDRMNDWLLRKSKSNKRKMDLRQENLNDSKVRESLPDADIVFFLNLHHHLEAPIEMLEILCDKCEGVLVTNGYQIESQTAPAPTKGRQKLGTNYVIEILHNKGLDVINLGQYREGRDLIVGYKK